MELDIKVCTSNTCEVVITDNTPVAKNGYLPEQTIGVAKNRFKRSDTVVIDTLILNKTEGQEIQTPKFTIASPNLVSTTIPVKFDGWFSVCRIVLPSKDWFDREIKKETNSAIQLYDVVYYSDGSYIYKYVDGSSQAATLEELTIRNPEGTTISIISKNYVSICFLKKMLPIFVLANIQFQRIL